MNYNEIGYAECVKGPLKERLCKGLDSMGLKPSASQVSQLSKYLEQLAKWNKVYNLTAVKNIDDMLSLHIFDCLAILQDLKEKMLGRESVKVLDVGSGAGLPSYVIAVMQPSWHVTAIDAVNKKMAFLQQQVQMHNVQNLKVVHGRVEKMLEKNFDLIISRAFSSLSDFINLTEPLILTNGYWCAMKAKDPIDEIAVLKDHIEVFHVKQLAVPNLDAERRLIWMRQRK